MAIGVYDVDHYLWSTAPFSPSRQTETKQGWLYIYNPEHGNPQEIKAGKAPIYSAKKLVAKAHQTVIATLTKYAYKGRSSWLIIDKHEADAAEEWNKKLKKLDKVKFD
jgi:hypothetical protein